MSTSSTASAATKGAALLQALANVPESRPDPNLGNRLLDIASMYVNDLLNERAENASDRSMRAMQNRRHLHNPDEDSMVHIMACGIALVEVDREDTGLTPAERDMAVQLASKVRAVLAKQFRGEKKPDSRKIHETLQHLG